MLEPHAETETSAHPRKRRRRALIWLLVMVVALLVSGVPKLFEGDEFVPLDTVAYLKAAGEVRERGGPLPLLWDCFRGSYRRANRMPLYIALLSMLPCDTAAVLVYAKVLSLLLGAVGVVVIFQCARNLFGLPAAVAAAAALAINTVYLLYSSVVACEILFTIWTTLAWWLIVRYLKGSGTFVWIGLTIGLTYLTKANGLFLAPLAVAAALYKERKRIFRARQFWLGVLTFFLVASPILVRNTRVYGSPFYNANSSVMWLDRWEDRFSPDPAVSRPSLRTYLRTHTPGQAAERFFRGGLQQGKYSVIAAGQTTLFSARLRLKVWPFGLLTLLLAMVPLARKQDRAAALTAWLIFGGFNLFFAWYPVKDIRFVMPLVPMMLVLAGRGVHLLLRRFAKMWRPAQRIAPWPVVAGVAGLVLLTNAALIPKRIPKTNALTPPPGYSELLTWLRDHSTENTVRMMGPSHAYEYFWSASLRGRRIPVPWVKSMEELQSVIRKKRVRYVVVDYSTLSQRRPAFAGWIRLKGKTVPVEQTPPGWQEIFTAGSSPAVIVFEISQPSNLFLNNI